MVPGEHHILFSLFSVRITSCRFSAPSVCVPTKYLCWNLVPQGNDIRSEGLGRRVLVNGIHAHIKQAQQNSLSPSRVQEYNQLWTRKWARNRHQCFDLALPSFQNWMGFMPREAPCTFHREDTARSWQSTIWKRVFLRTWPHWQPDLRLPSAQPWAVNFCCL